MYRTVSPIAVGCWCSQSPASEGVQVEVIDHGKNHSPKAASQADDAKLRHIALQLLLPSSRVGLVAPCGQSLVHIRFHSPYPRHHALLLSANRCSGHRQL